MIDFDYLDKLSDEEKQWLSNFNEEYLSGNFNHPGKIFHKKKKEKRECYTRNNARNRDIYALYRTRGWVPVIEGDPKVESKNPNPSSQEDAIIEMIDLSREDT